MNRKIIKNLRISAYTESGIRRFLRNRGRGSASVPREWLFISFRKNNFKYEEENDHGNSACNKGNKYVVYSRSYICRCNRHPQVVKSVTD